MRKRYELYCASCEATLGWYWTLSAARRAENRPTRHDVGVADRKGMTV